MTPALEERVAPLVRTTRILWAVFFASVPVYVAVAQLALSGVDAAAPTPVPQTMLLMLSLVAFASAVGAIVLPRFYPPASVLRQLAQQESRAPAAVSPARGPAPRSEVTPRLSPAEERAYRWASLFPPHCINRFAFAESIVIYGFVLSFVSKRPEFTIYFGIPCLLVLILIFPKIDPFMERWEQAAMSR